MTVSRVLIVVGLLPSQPAILIDAVRRLREHGATVDIATFFDPARMGDDPALAGAHDFLVPNDRIDSRLRRATRGVQLPRQVWAHARRDGWVRQQARRADMLVAVDHYALHTVWELAQRNVRADAVYGLVPAIAALDARGSGGPRTADVLRRWAPAKVAMMTSVGRRIGVQGGVYALDRLTGRRVMSLPGGAQFWTTAITAPGIPDRVRGQVAVPIHRGLVQAGRGEMAVRTSQRVRRKLRSADARADMLARQAHHELNLGRMPLILDDAVQAKLDRSDAWVAKKDMRLAASALTQASELAFNRVVHFDRLSSPLAADPQGYLAPLHASAVMSRITQPRGRALPAAPPPTERPMRLLLATFDNQNFLREIREHYENTPNVEVRLLDLNEDEVRSAWLRRGHYSVSEHILYGQSAFGANVEEWLRPHLDWADTVFVDWCVNTAALFTLHDPGTTRIVVRLHSFEAFNLWPHLVDWSRVDDLVFVSEHLRDLTTAVVPRLAAAGAPRLSVIPNAMDLVRFAREKPADAQYTLGMVGFAAVAKDPRWSMEVLRLLRKRDDRYRLLLIGGNFNVKVSAAARQYGADLNRDLIELEPSGAVRRLGQTDDVPGALADVGVILSSSVRESFHCGLVEGVASGAVPVVRDWPFFAGGAHGARTLFPPDWVVSSPAEAAERILAVTATEEGWRAAGKAAAEHAVSAWDWSVVRHDFDRLLLPGQAG